MVDLGLMLLALSAEDTFSVVTAVIVLISMWSIFTKAGEPGWMGLIPILNTIVLIRIVGRQWWWIFLLLVPCVNVVIWILLMIDLAKAFGKGAGFTVGLILLSFVFFPILAFGSAQYVRGGPDPAVFD